MNSEKEEETQPPKKPLNTDVEDLDRKPTGEEKYLTEKNEKKYKKRERIYKQDKKISFRRKYTLKYESFCKEYDNFMLSNLEKKKNHKESPHIVIKRSFHLIQKKSIILKKATVIFIVLIVREIFAIRQHCVTTKPLPLFYSNTKQILYCIMTNVNTFSCFIFNAR